MTDDRAPSRRTVVGLVLAVVAGTTAVGAVLGYALPAWVGLEEITVFEMVVPISPGAVALYSGVTIGVFLITFLLVVQVISQFDENAM